MGIDDPASWSVPSWHSRKPRSGAEGRAAVRTYRADMKAAGKPEYSATVKDLAATLEARFH